MQLKTRSQCKTSYQKHLRGLLDSIIVSFGKWTTFATTHFSASSKLHRYEKGLDGYRKFVKERLVPDAPMSVWSTMKRMKLKTFSTWMAKTLVSVGDKVIKLREERQLLGRFLVIQQSRPELILRLPATIGNLVIMRCQSHLCQCHSNSQSINHTCG